MIFPRGCLTLILAFFRKGERHGRYLLRQFHSFLKGGINHGSILHREGGKMNRFHILPFRDIVKVNE